MPNYENGKIYKIVADGFKVYIGSTTLSLDDRFRHFKNSKKHYSCSPMLNLESCRIELIENYSCENRTQLVMRERYWYDKTDCINDVKPYQSKKEKKEYFREYSRKYMNENRSKYKKEYSAERQHNYYKKSYAKQKIYLDWLKSFRAI